MSESRYLFLKSIVDLQCRRNFYCTATWPRHMYTPVHPSPPPSPHPGNCTSALHVCEFLYCFHHGLSQEMGYSSPCCKIWIFNLFYRALFVYLEWTQWNLSLSCLDTYFLLLPDLIIASTLHHPPQVHSPYSSRTDLLRDKLEHGLSQIQLLQWFCTRT